MALEIKEYVGNGNIKTINETVKKNTTPKKKKNAVVPASKKGPKKN
jgi:hypothetical protein